jgi:hypothetical protein
MASCLANHLTVCPATSPVPLTGHCREAARAGARDFAGCLAGCFADIARPSRGTPCNYQRAIGEMKKPCEIKGYSVRCIKLIFCGIRLHCSLKIVAHDFSRFVRVIVQFGGTIRGMNLKRICACRSMDTSATV